MRRYIEYGALSAAVLTLVYLIVTYLFQGYFSVSVIFLCIAGGVVSGVVVAMLFAYFAPGLHIPEGDEDSYINN